MSRPNIFVRVLQGPVSSDISLPTADSHDPRGKPGITGVPKPWTSIFVDTASWTVTTDGEYESFIIIRFTNVYFTLFCL